MVIKRSTSSYTAIKNTVILPGPEARYQQLVDLGELQEDPDQQAALQSLGTVAKALKLNANVTVAGLYLWGDVGRGKTRLMDIFYESLGDAPKLRLHFHHFMRLVHQGLRQVQWAPEPLGLVAQQFSDQYQVLCLDEFFVADIGDAMILYRLFDALFAHGVTLVATSNIAIDALYQNGLHRRRFEPAIQLLQAHLDSVHLTGQFDHRLRPLTVHQTYFVGDSGPLNNIFQRSSCADCKSKSNDKAKEFVTVCGREIQFEKQCANTIWFRFEAICCGPRSAEDYIDIASKYRHVLISGVPQLGGEKISGIKARGTEDGALGATETGARIVSFAKSDNAARRMISLVDEFYDQGTKLYISAEVSLEFLYPKGALEFEFRRTRSRLIEMQSDEYLNRNSKAN